MTTTWTDASTRSDAAHEAGLRILIAEDQADCADSLAGLLRGDGHEVEVARDGPAALEMAEADEPDVVLLDLGLPGMSGFDVARHISDHRPWKKTPLLIAVTGLGQAEDRRHSSEVGIDLHLVKPTDMEQLRIVLTRFQRVIDNRLED